MTDRSTEELRGELNPQIEQLLELLSKYDTTLTAGTVEEARQQHDAMMELAGGDPVAVGAISDFTIETENREIPARMYVPAGDGPFPTVAYYHGGGFVLGNIESHDNLCRLLAARSECVVVSVEYRLAPEHPWPAGLEDCYATAKWLEANAEELSDDIDGRSPAAGGASLLSGSLAVAGDSAGGNLAATVSLLARERGMPDIDCQLLLYPTTAYLEPMPSRAQNASGYILTASDLLWFLEQYVTREIDAYNPLAFPLQARDLSRLPPAFVMTCGFDPLRDEGITYAERLRKAGCDVQHSNYESMVHGFLNMDGLIDRTEDGINETAAYLQRKLV